VVEVIVVFAGSREGELHAVTADSVHPTSPRAAAPAQKSRVQRTKRYVSSASEAQYTFHTRTLPHGKPATPSPNEHLRMRCPTGRVFEDAGDDDRLNGFDQRGAE